MTSPIEISPKLISFLTTLFIFSHQLLFSQCLNGTQPECACETAPVLCSVDELDGYVFSMSDFLHPQDGPSPICSSAPGSQTNNPTWFAFTAWCTNLTLRARPSNCHWYQGYVGVQIAIYEDCTFQNAVACDVDIQDCNTGTKVLAMTGLTIGGVYYFMVDGCLGSYCDVTIDVVGVCGQEEIAPWSMPVTGEINPCVGDAVTYTVENLDGAGVYHWFLDGVLMGQSPSTSFSTVWTTPGSYQLCIDASNDPCVPVTDAPSPLCLTIVVHESDAGTLSVSPSPLCLNEIATITSAGYTPGVDNTQIILITDASGIIEDVIPAASGSYTSSSGGTFTVYAFNYVTSDGTVPVIGTNINDIDCGPGCCDLESQTITFQGLQAEVSNILCNNNGTDNNPSDDTFIFDLLVTGQTPGTFWRSTDGTLDGTYGTILQCGPYSIDAGWLNFDLHDYDVPACFTSITVIPPSACSVCLQSLDAGTGSTINCINTTATLTGISSETGNYNWTGPGSFFSNTLTTSVSDSGWYYLNVVFPNQCALSDSVFIDMDTDTPVADAGTDQILDCNQLDVFLDGSASTGNNMQYEWIDESGSVISTQVGVWVSKAAIYTLHVTNTLNGCVSVDNVNVMTNPDIPAWISADVSTENCDGENNGMIEVTGISGGVPPYSYSLNGLMTNATGFFSGLIPGEYMLQITDSKGCILDTFFTIQPGINLQLELPSIIELIVGNTGMIEAKVNVPVSELSSIQWSPEGLLSCDSCLTTTINALTNYSFQLTVVHQRGCVAVAELNITVVPETEIYMPNIFSPNGDGNNDYFTLYANDRVDMILALNIFDRWGELVFERKNFNPNDTGVGWDGKFKGKDMLPSVFAYYVEVLMVNGDTEIISGNVTLVK